MAFTLDHVKRLQEINLDSEQINAQSVISDRLKIAPLLTQRELYEFLKVTMTVKRKRLVERDVPNGCYRKCCCCLEVSVFT